LIELENQHGFGLFGLDQPPLYGSEEDRCFFWPVAMRESLRQYRNRIDAEIRQHTQALPT
jgi:hypothetical protein